jgi:hypothetical protein
LQHERQNGCGLWLPDNKKSDMGLKRGNFVASGRLLFPAPPLDIRRSICEMELLLIFIKNLFRY